MKRYKISLSLLITIIFLQLSAPPADADDQMAPAQMSIQQLVNNIRSKLTENPNRSSELAQELAQRTPSGTTETRAILRLIGNTQGELQQQLIDCIANIDNPRLGQLFIAELENKYPLVSATAAGMCGKLKLKDSVPGLIDIIKRYGKVDGFADSPAERAGVTAIVALGEIKDTRGIPILLDKLGHMNNYEVKALVKFGHQVIPQLFDKIKNSEDKLARRSAAYAVVSINDPQAIPLLKQEVENKESRVRKYAIIGLLNIAPEQSLDELLALWEQGTDFLLERQLLYYINSARLKDEKLCPFLIKLLDDNPHKDIRQKAALALGRIGCEQAITALKKALRDEEKMVRMYAAQALQMLTGQTYDIEMSDI